LLNSRRRAAWLDLALKYGKTFALKPGVTATCDPEMVEALLMQRSHCEERAKIHRTFAQAVPGLEGILFLDREPWTVRLTALMPVFARSHVDGFARAFHETATAHCDRWTQGGSQPDLFQAVSALGFDCLSLFGFKLDPDEPLARELEAELEAWKTRLDDPKNRLDDALVGATKIFFVLKSRRAQTRSVKRVGELIEALIEGGFQRADAVSWISQLQAAGLTLEDVAAEQCHLFYAYDAINYAIVCALVELAKSPEWTERVRRDYERVLGDRMFLERTDFANLSDAAHFKSEVLRCYPVTMGAARKSGEPIPFEGGEIPAGKDILILLHALHHHPDFWAHGERFDPTRWADGKTPETPYSYVPFLKGPRKCIGEHLATLQFHAVLCAILRRGDLTVEVDELQTTRYMTPRFEGAIPFSVDRRTGDFQNVPAASSTER